MNTICKQLTMPREAPLKDIPLGQAFMAFTGQLYLRATNGFVSLESGEYSLSSGGDYIRNYVPVDLEITVRLESER